LSGAVRQWLLPKVQKKIKFELSLR
jgi:hypothetical protein